MRKLEDIQIWRKAIKMAKEIYAHTSKLPSSEKFNLISQMQRAAVSVPSNIAEGAGRNSEKEFLHFLSIAHGSLYELETQVIIANELNFIDKEVKTTLIEQIQEIQKMSYSFQRTLKANG